MPPPRGKRKVWFKYEIFDGLQVKASNECYMCHLPDGHQLVGCYSASTLFIKAKAHIDAVRVGTHWAWVMSVKLHGSNKKVRNSSYAVYQSLQKLRH